MSEEGRKKVLIVEDEPETLELYHQFLKNDYEVVGAEGGKEGLDKFSEDTDIVLLDRRMPDLHGDRVLKRIREDSEVPVILLTAVDADMDIVDLPFTDYVHKPVGKEELKERVNEALSVKGYDELLDRYYSLINKKQALEESIDEEYLSEEEKYIDLKEELSEVEKRLEDRTQEIMEKIPITETEEFEKLLRSMFD